MSTSPQIDRQFGSYRGPGLPQVDFLRHEQLPQCLRDGAGARAAGG